MRYCSCGHKNSPPCKLYKILLFAVPAILILYFFIQNTSVFYRNDIALPFSLHLNKQQLYLVKGEEYKLFVYRLNKRVSYKTTNFRVAGVNFNGRVIAYRTGKAFIIARVGDKELKCRVYVIDLNKDKLTLDVGASYRLKVKGCFAFTKYKSSYPEVASVSWFGRVKAKKKGRAVITARIKGKLLKCTVTVK